VLGTVGDAVTWCFVATNTGDVALTNVLFTDTPAGITDLDLLADRNPAILAVGESLSFSENGTIAAGGVDNVASVTGAASDPTGTPVPGVPPVTDSDDAAINEAAVDLQKTVIAGADGDCAAAGELATVNTGTEVTYCFTVTNTGAVPIEVTEVVDTTLGVTIPVPAASQVLAPGAAVTVTHVATATVELVNTAQVTATPLDPTTGAPVADGPELEDDDDAEVDTLEANLAIVKTDEQDFVVTGGGQTYTLAVSNAGPDPAVDVVVVDELPEQLSVINLPDVADWACTVDGQKMTCVKATPLAAGDSVDLSYLVQVSDNAVVGTILVNVATVSSDTPDPDLTDNEDDEDVVPILPEIIGTVEPPQPLPPITSGPAPVPAPAPSPAPPAPPLAVTGVSSGWLAMASAAMLAAGGTFFVGGRRRAGDLG